MISPSALVPRDIDRERLRPPDSVGPLRLGGSSRASAWARSPPPPRELRFVPSLRSGVSFLRPEPEPEFRRSIVVLRFAIWSDSRSCFLISRW